MDSPQKDHQEVDDAGICQNGVVLHKHEDEEAPMEDYRVDRFEDAGDSPFGSVEGVEEGENIAQANDCHEEVWTTRKDEDREDYSFVDGPPVLQGHQEVPLMFAAIVIDLPQEGGKAQER